MEPGDHACVIYSAAPELISVVAEYLDEGLRAAEQCWYAASSMGELSEVRMALRAHDIDVMQAEEQGSLRLMTSTELYLADGIFEPERAVEKLNAAISAAAHDGFSAFRVAGEMSWALKPNPGTDRILEYEGSAELLLRASEAVALCLYHRRRMPAQVLDGALTSHPLAGVGGGPRPNAFYRPKPIADLRTPQSDDISWKLKHLQRSGH
jgi:hypothetical protein